VSIEIRRAKPDEAAALTELAQAAKRYWRYPETWIEQWKADLTITPEFLNDNDVFVAIVDGEIAGCCALVMRNLLAEIEHMWIKPERMGSGVGRALFDHAKQRAEQRGARALELSADPNAAGFYERMGAKYIGEIPAGMNGDEHRVLPRMRIDL
jgi:N-acetylglutamate synthase-like GNAT family acetyltransferase